MTNGAPKKELPVEVPKLLLDGYYGKLTDEREAIIKKLDTSSSPESDDEFTNQEFSLSIYTIMSNDIVSRIISLANVVYFIWKKNGISGYSKM